MQKLDRTLGPLMLWGLGVGNVISGMYFGWNLGLPRGGTLGLAISTLFITLMYVFFTFSYCELACAIPKAGGAFDYANRSLGHSLGFMAGMAQFVEFTFAPPAVAYAIGAYVHEFLPGVPVIAIACMAFVAFTALNILGVKAAARFELLITLFAVFELLVFAGVALPHFQMANLTHNAFPNGVTGIFASVPFAIWFYLGIEGVANVAEETLNPQKNVGLGFGSAMLTLVALCVLTFVSAVGVGGWEHIVYPIAGDTSKVSDSPLPLALSHIISKGNVLYHMLVAIGLFGLIASFHGTILAGGRATFEFGRLGYFPRILGTTHAKYRTPMWALIANMLVGILAIFTGKTGDIIIIACFGAVMLYVLSLVSFFWLRRTRPDMPRPYRAPLYPYAQVFALLLAVLALVAMVVFNPVLAGIFAGIVATAQIWFTFFVGPDSRKAALQPPEV